jgi:MoaA/NifB/PqqE/SkfB family radical SAM enzyme
MNLIITDRCNRACPYCFAQEKVRLSGQSEGGRFLAFADLEYYLEFLRRSGIADLKLLGGEPSLHPEFQRIVRAGLERGLKVTVFTNGLWPAQVMDFVAQTDTVSFSFLFNVNEPHIQPKWESARQAESLALAGSRGMLGFNIFRTDFDLRFGLELVDRFGLKREIRLGLAHPIAGHANDFVKDRELPLLGERLLAQMEELEKKDVLVALDCGFPLCMFPEDKLDRLVTSAKPGRYSICGPIIDVGPDLTAWPCFPLSRLLNVSLRDFSNAKELVKHYEHKLAAVRNIGFLDRCLECRFRRRGQCCAGCVARTLRNWEEEGDHDILEKLG